MTQSKELEAHFEWGIINHSNKPDYATKTAHKIAKCFQILLIYMKIHPIRIVGTYKSCVPFIIHNGHSGISPCVPYAKKHKSFRVPKPFFPQTSSRVLHPFLRLFSPPLLFARIVK